MHMKLIVLKLFRYISYMKSEVCNSQQLSLSKDTVATIIVIYHLATATGIRTKIKSYILDIILCC